MKYLMTTLLLAASFPAAALAQGAPDMRNVVKNSYDNIALNSFGNCVRSNYSGTTDECGPEVVAAQARPIDIEQEARTVYFDFNKASITPEAAAKLDSLASQLKEDNVSQARIHGYADRIGTVSYNEQLSKKRAESVRQYLISRGFIKGRVADTRWMGESVPVTSCPDHLTREELIACLAKDRRVEVEIDHLQEK